MNEPIAASVLDLVGRTPLVRLARLSPPGGASVVGKLESKNPGGSVKDRPALAMVEAAERAGKLTAGATLVEATSGNTGISLAMIAAVRGYRCVLVMPDDMSLERATSCAPTGPSSCSRPPSRGWRAPSQRAEEIARARPPAPFMPRQFDNPANPEAPRADDGARDPRRGRRAARRLRRRRRHRGHHHGRRACPQEGAPVGARHRRGAGGERGPLADGRAGPARHPGPRRGLRARRPRPRPSSIDVVTVGDVAAQRTGRTPRARRGAARRPVVRAPTSTPRARSPDDCRTAWSSPSSATPASAISSDATAPRSGTAPLKLGSRFCIQAMTPSIDVLAAQELQLLLALAAERVLDRAPARVERRA